MIDTLKLRIQSSELTDVDYRAIEEKLTRKRIITNQYNISTMRGFIQNMNVTLDYRGVWIEGSLPKYLYGTNQKTLSFIEVTNAINYLGEEVGLNLWEARVERVDIGDNIMTKYPVENYYPILMHCNQFKRNELDNGLGFRSINRYLSFYGKIQEVKKNKELPVEMFIGRNVLRYEYRHLNNKSISSAIGIRKINLESLLKNYKKLVEDWYSAFSSIRKKHKTLDFDYNIFEQNGRFDKYLKVKGIDAFGGMKEVIEAVNSAKSQGYLQRYPNQGSNIIKRLQETYSTADISRLTDLGKELQVKIFTKKQVALTNLKKQRANL